MTLRRMSVTSEIPIIRVLVCEVLALYKCTCIVFLWHDEDTCA